MKRDFDVIVVGAGPGGTSAAICCAHNGLSVLLCERARPGRDKICGDGLGAATVSFLDRLGVASRLLEHDPWVGEAVILSTPDGTRVRCRIPAGRGQRDHGWVVPRRILDRALLDTARQTPGVTTLTGFNVRDIQYEGPLVRGVLGVLEGRSEVFTGRVIIGADGAHSIVGKRLGLENRDPRHLAFAVRGYYENVAHLDHAIEIHFDEKIVPGYGWIFPTGPDTANVGVGAASRFAPKKDIRRLFDVFVQTNRFAREKLAQARLVPETLRGWPIPNGSHPGPRSRKNVLLIGDAASFVDPLTGEGIYFALRSGDLAARAVSQALSRKDPAAAGDFYEKSWRRAFNCREFLPAYLLQTLASKTAVVNAAGRRLEKSRRLQAIAAGAIAHNLPKARLLFPF